MRLINYFLCFALVVLILALSAERTRETEPGPPLAYTVHNPTMVGTESGRRLCETFETWERTIEQRHPECRNNRRCHLADLAIKMCGPRPIFVRNAERYR